MDYQTWRCATLEAKRPSMSSGTVCGPSGGSTGTRFASLLGAFFQALIESDPCSPLQHFVFAKALLDGMAPTLELAMQDFWRMLSGRGIAGGMRAKSSLACAVAAEWKMSALITSSGAVWRTARRRSCFEETGMRQPLVPTAGRLNGYRMPFLGVFGSQLAALQRYFVTVLRCWAAEMDQDAECIPVHFAGIVA